MGSERERERRRAGMNSIAAFMASTRGEEEPREPATAVCPTCGERSVEALRMWSCSICGSCWRDEGRLDPKPQETGPV